MGISSNLNLTKAMDFSSKVAEGIKESVLERAQALDEQADIKVEDAENPNITAINRSKKDIDGNGGIEQHRPRKVSEGKRILPPEQVKEQAEQFQQNNQEFKFHANAQTDLLNLAKNLRSCTSSKEILNLVKTQFAKYPPELQKKVFDFLEAISIGDLKGLVRQARTEFETTGAAMSKSIADIAEAERPDTEPSTLKTLEEQGGEPLSSTSVAEQYLKKFSSIDDIKKDLDQIQHGIGAKIKSQDAVEALLINLGKEGQVTQDTRALFNLAATIHARIEKQCMLKGIDAPNISQEEMVKCILSIIAHPRISGDKVLSMAHSLVGAY